MSLFSRFWRKKKVVEPPAPEQSSSSESPVPFPYVLPNDLREVNRLDFQHYMLRYALQGNYLAPLDTRNAPISILDVGCGSGRWLYEMSQQFPSSALIGVDHVSPPSTPFTASSRFNFVQHNVLQPFPFPDASFAFTHQRLLVLGLPIKSWPLEVSELVRITSPGGWIELVESDGFFSNAGPSTLQLNEYGQIAMRQRGIDPLQVRNIKILLESNGLQRTYFQPISIPVGLWGGRIGQMSLSNTQVAIEGVKSLLISTAGVTPAAFDDFLQQVYQEFESNHSSLQFYIACGQRPL